MAKLKCIPTTEAVGHVLCHDITQIIKGQSKGPRFRKGHIVKEEDIPEGNWYCPACELKR